MSSSFINIFVSFILKLWLYCVIFVISSRIESSS